MQVRVRLFARYREIAAQSQLALDVPEGSTAEDVHKALESRFPDFSLFRPYVQFAVNQEFVSATTSLKSGDEVALLQPLGGGE